MSICFTPRLLLYIKDYRLVLSMKGQRVMYAATFGSRQNNLN